jgi:hypothetical protein
VVKRSGGPTDSFWQAPPPQRRRWWRPRPPHAPRRDSLTLAIAIAGIAATLIGTLTGAAISGHQQSVLQDKNLTAQAVDSDKKELRGVVDDAEAALEAAARAANMVRPIRDPSTSDPSETTVVRANESSFRRAEDRVGAMTALRASLTIRLGADHPLTRIYTAAQAGLRAKARCARLSDFLGPEDNPLDALIDKSVTAFQGEARRLLGSSVGGPVAGSATPTRVTNYVQLQRLADSLGRRC